MDMTKLIVPLSTPNKGNQCTVLLPDTCPKHCVRVAMANPVASAVARVTEKVGVDAEVVEAPPAPVAAPQTMKT